VTICQEEILSLDCARRPKQAILREVRLIITTICNWRRNTAMPLQGRV